MLFHPRWIRRILSVAVVGSSFATAFLVTGWRPAGRQVDQAPRTRAHLGPELLAVFVGSSGCGASQDPGLPAAMQAIKDALRQEAKRAKRSFASVGVSIDSDPEAGIDFLRKFGPFDEELVGGGWLNTGAVMFLIRDFPSVQAIPQLILIERDVVVSKDTGISSVTDHLVGRKVGSPEIVTFSDSLKKESS